MSGTTNGLTQVVLGTTFLILMLAGFILTILFLYRKKQIAYLKELETVRSETERTMLNTQLEIQEQTFQNISREIHDHICLNLTLAKLNLVTVEVGNKNQLAARINSSIEILSKSISELSDISHSMNPELIESFGLIKTLEMEIEKMERPGLINIHYRVTGNPVFMNSQKELVIFRIIQEAFNNIIKHSNATEVKLNFNYNQEHLDVLIDDNGNGFSPSEINYKENVHAGLINMKNRAKAFGGTLDLISSPNSGTQISITPPYF